MHHEANKLLGRFNDIAISPEKYMAYQLQASVAYLQCRKLKPANESILRAINTGRHQTDLLIFRACRLFHLVVHTELGNNEFVAYEIRAYKRAFHGKANVIPFEKFLFEVMLTDLKTNSRANNRRLAQKVQDGLASMEPTPSQIKMLLYFDFVGWLEVWLIR
jgi:hypothetical protein